MRGNSAIESTWYGRMGYEKGLELQDKVRHRIAGGGNDHLILLEHPPVYTFGKSANPGNMLITDQLLASIGATVHQTERGGDVTFHGPGQLVGYPIIDLNRMHLGARKYVDLLQESVIQLIGEFGLAGYPIDGLTGIWVRSADGSENKIGAIGIKISRGISMHGFALNLNTDLNYFNYINPCGILDKGVTSVAKETGKVVDLERAADRYAQIFSELLRRETVESI